MSGLALALTKLDSYHLIAWGALVGTQVYQTFIVTKLCYLYLPRPQFTTLQKRVFPVYFGLELALVVATAVTYPSGSLVALRNNTLDSALLGITLGMSALNFLIYGPRTTEAMIQRSHQETREQLKSKEKDAGATATNGEAPVSPEMHKAKRKFSHNHAMSIHLNLIGVITCIVYGISLSSRMA
ncbi:hypothetical protein F5884DRAFT_789278 [Xylogone sp. PMI_703]|nr:hypothetical protein F5884DRAFT_789278 [Xylogone sp. PMI_703]